MLFLLEKFIFLALVFSLPFQKRFFLFGLPAEVSAKAGPDGFFEWSSGFLYFTDFLVLFLFLFWLKDLFPVLRKGSGHSQRFVPAVLLLFLGLAFISLTQAELIDAGVYRFIKLTEFIFLFFYAVARAPIIGIKPILGIFVASGAFQSILAILQFAKQSSLGLEIFHESTLAIGMKGVAEISAGGVEFIRAYGTFPSPNVLAGFLGICLLFLFYFFVDRETSDSPLKSQKWSDPFPLLMYVISIFFLTFGLILTFSRGVIIFFLFTTVLFFAGMFLFKQFKQYKKQAAGLAVLVIASWAFVIAAAWPEVSSRFLESSVSEPAIQERFFFNQVGADTISKNYSHLFFGVGIGNFVNYYMNSLPGLAPHLYQPVHNIFILIASEIGVFGLIAFIIFLATVIKNSVQYLSTRHRSHDRGNDVSIFILLSVVCFMLLVGMYDHYFWTLQQGALMFWITLGLIASAVKFSR